MKRFHRLVTVLLLLSFSLPASSWPNEKEITLEEVVVTATRDVEEVQKDPCERHRHYEGGDRGVPCRNRRRSHER